MPMRPLDASIQFQLNWHLDRMKEQCATRIAELLNDAARWHSHARGIDAKTLRDEVGLRIDNLTDEPKLHGTIRAYFNLLKDYMGRQELYSFVHTRGYF